MTIRNVQEFMDSGELDNIYLGGTDASVNKVMTNGDIATSEAWTDVTVFSNSWESYNSDFTVSYKKLKNGMVLLKGAVKNGSSPTLPSTLFTLPAGYLPFFQSAFVLPATWTLGETCNLYISAATGNVIAYDETAAGAAENFLSLTSISFLAEN